MDMAVEQTAHAVTFDSPVPDDYKARHLRSSRAFHPTHDPKQAFQFESRTRDSSYKKQGRSPPRRDNDDNLHYPDGTVIDAGPRSSLDADDDQPVTLHGFAGAEWFDDDVPGYRSHHYWRCLYNVHTGTLTIDKWNGHHRTEYVNVTLPPERIADPQAVVDAIAATDSPVETVELLDVFFTADVSTDALEDIAGKDALTRIL